LGGGYKEADVGGEKERAGNLPVERMHRTGHASRETATINGSRTHELSYEHYCTPPKIYPLS
jgi:hypothetical protein